MNLLRCIWCEPAMGIHVIMPGDSQGDFLPSSLVCSISILSVFLVHLLNHQQIQIICVLDWLYLCVGCFPDMFGIFKPILKLPSRIVAKYYQSPSTHCDVDPVCVLCFNVLQPSMILAQCVLVTIELIQHALICLNPVWCWSGQCMSPQIPHWLWCSVCSYFQPFSLVWSPRTLLADTLKYVTHKDHNALQRDWPLDK